MGRFEQAALVVVCAVTLLKLLPAPAGPAGNWTAVPLVIPAPPPPPEVAGPAAQHAELRWPQAEEEEEATPSLATAYDQPLARPQPGAEGELSPEKEEEAVEAVVGGEAAEDAELQATTAESQLPAEPPAEPPIATAEPVSSAAEAAVPAPPGGCGDGSTTIFSRRVVTRNATLSAVVVARHGVIVSVTPADAPPPGALDFSEFVVSPGLVDVHVHLNEPGRDWEGFASGTAAAAAGCLTTLVDQPLNSRPAVTSVAALRAKLAAAAAASAAGSLRVDVAFWGGLVPANAADGAALGALLDAGAVGLKAFLVPSGVDDFPAASLGDVAAALPVLASRGKPLMVHAELQLSPPGGAAAAAAAVAAGGDAAAEAGAQQQQPGDPRLHATWAASRPPEWESAAVAALLQLARPDVRLHVAHLSDAGRALGLLRAARQAGANVSAETCPHYLTWSGDEVADGQTRLKCAPPLRGARNRDALWAALLAGDVSSLGSDHSPAPADLKALDTGDFVRAWGGVASLQLALPATWEGARTRGATFAHLASWWSEQPALLAGLQRTKGAIEPGRDADLCVWNPDGEVRPLEEGTHHRHAGTPYDGRTLHGRVRATFLRGRVAFDDHHGLPADACGRTVLLTA